jgi:fructose-1,6-bisphosphatase/inositol monophosphatase family enzyme
VYEALVRAARRSRSWGDGYGYALVATGRAEIMIDPRLAIWDAAPLLPVLVEAGGAFTDWSGRARVDGGNGVATNGRLHEAVLGILGRAAAP